MADPIDAINSVRLAALVHGWLADRCTQREKQILDQLIGEYRSGVLQNENMRSKIGEISALRFVISQAQKEAKQPVPTESD